MLTNIIAYGLPAVSLALLAAAGACFVYVPLLGRYAAAALVAISVGLLAFDEGFKVRGGLDKSADLKTEIEGLNAALAEAKREAQADRAIADKAAAAESAAEDAANVNQQKVQDYEALLASHGAPSCGMSESDVGSLSAIGARAATRNPAASQRSGAVRKAGSGS